MKKLLTLLLILALLLPAAVLAEEKDPIIGCWYMYANVKEYPELISSFGDIDSLLSLYYFTEDNLIIGADTTIKDGQGTQTCGTIGRWENTGNDYKVSLAVLGENRAYIEGDCMMIGVGKVGAIDVYMKIHRTIQFDMYKDYLYK